MGRSVRLARGIAGMSRAESAARAGISRSTWERIENGSPSVTLATLVAATDAVGLDLVCQTYPGRGPALRDTGQLAIAQLLADLASPTWRMSLEERAGDHGEAVDQVFWGPREIVAVEIERMMLDYQGQYRRASVKRNWLAAHHARPVRLVLVIEDTRRNRTAMAPYAALIGSALPLGSRAILQAIRTAGPLGADGLCWVRRPSPRARR